MSEPSQTDLNKRPPIDAYFQFEVRPGTDEEASRLAGRAVYKDEHWVIQRPKGDPTSVTEYKAASLRRSRPQIWALVEPAYTAWANGMDEPLDGVPLKGWSGCTEAQRMTLASFNLKTVEDLSNATDAIGDKIPQFRKMKQVAKNYLTGIGDGSRLAEENAALKAELDEVSARNQTLAADLEEMKEQIAALVKARAA